MLVYISALRNNAGYFRSNKRDQGNLYFLEYIIEEALDLYDPQGALKIKDFIGRIDVMDEYVFLIYQAVCIEFLNSGSGKARFRKVPALLADYFSTGPAYKKFVASLEQSAKKQNCEITDLDFSDFPDIKW